MNTIQILHSDSRLVTGRWNDLYVESIRAKFDASLIRQTNELQIAASRLPGLGRMASVSLMHSGISMRRTEEMDTLNDETMDAVGGFTKAGVGVLLSRGFAAAVSRSLFAGFSLLKRTPFPVDLVDSVSAACVFIAPHLEGRPPLQDVARAIEEIDCHGR